MLGAIMALLAAAGFGTSAVFARVALQHMRATTGTLVSLIVGTTIVMTLALLIHWEAVFALAGVAFLWFLLSGSINFPIGRLLNFTGVRLAGVAKSSPIVGSSPMFAIALAVTVGGETVNAPILVGTMAIIGGLTLILTQR